MKMLKKITGMLLLAAMLTFWQPAVGVIAHVPLVPSSDVMAVIFMRGSTAYEVQVGRIYIRWTHLRGGAYWRRKPWRRLSVRWLNTED